MSRKQSIKERNTKEYKRRPVSITMRKAYEYKNYLTMYRKYNGLY
jgi:hypothetical protein